MNKEKDDYKVCMWGTTISKHEANKIGLALIIGLIGAFLSFLVFGAQNKVTVFIISFTLAAFGYFGIANKVFKDKSKT